MSQTISSGYAEGMPPFDHDVPPLSFFEFWPGKYFYIPLKIHNILYSLWFGGINVLTAANPHITAGGFVGETKSEVYDLFPKSREKYLAKYTAVLHTGNPEQVYEKAIKSIAQKKLKFPFVAKPDIGCKGAGVQKIKNDTMLRSYIKDFPEGENIVFQELVEYEPEVGLFYIRKPNEDKGQIFSLTLKYFPFVTGDGTSTLEQLILSDPRASKIAHKYLPRHKKHLSKVLNAGEIFKLCFAGSHTEGAIFKNGNAYITPAMEEFFDKLTSKLPEFYFGRFDIRFKDMSSLETGKNMKIIEINGVGAEATHIWDSRTSLWGAYKTLFKQYQLAYQIGAINKKRGFAPTPTLKLWNIVKEHEKLVKVYPEAH